MSALGKPNFAAWTEQGGMPGVLGGNLSVADKVPPDMLHLVDHHWYQFPPLNPLWHGIFGFVIAVLAIVSVAGNFMVVYIFTTTKSLRTPSNLLIVNLAFSDFLMMCAMSPAFIINCYYETWVLGPLMCDLYGLAGSLFGCISIWTMTVIALDRYNVIVKGLSAKPMTVRGTVLRLFLVWVFSLFWTLCPLFGWNRYVPEGNMAACGTDYLTKNWFSRSYILAYSLFVYFTPLFTIIYSYWHIVQTVAAHEKSMREQAKKMNVITLRSGEAANTSAEYKLAKIALMTITLWFMAWTPYLITNYNGVLEITIITPLSTIWCSLFAKASAVYNPIVYAISHPKYKQALYKKFPSLACAVTTDESQSTASGVVNVAAEENTKA